MKTKVYKTFAYQNQRWQWYWEDKETKQVNGPFLKREDASVAARQARTNEHARIRGQRQQVQP